MVQLASFAALVFYASGFYQYWRRFRTTAGDEGDRRAYLPLLTVLALLCHALATLNLIATPEGFTLSLLGASNIVAFIMVAVVAIANVRLPVENLYFFLFPVSALVLLADIFVEPRSEPLENVTVALGIHILISLAAYSGLMMAAFQSVLLAVQERHLKQHRTALLAILPPLETMERLLVAMLWIGLVLLTGSILSGYLFMEDMFGQNVVHHTVLTSLSWLVYVAFLVGHYRAGWRGITAVRWTLTAFILLVLGYVGSKFVLEYLITR